MERLCRENEALRVRQKEAELLTREQERELARLSETLYLIILLISVIKLQIIRKVPCNPIMLQILGSHLPVRSLSYPLTAVWKNERVRKGADR